MREIHGCGSHSCYIKKPTGQGTNSGCRCFDGLSTERRLNLQRYIASLKDTESLNKLEIIMDFLFIEKVEDLCPKCSGRGRITYGSTSIWKGGVGGQTMTVGVCDECWGSGDITHKGADLRTLYSKMSHYGSSTLIWENLSEDNVPTVGVDVLVQFPAHYGAGYNIAQREGNGEWVICNDQDGSFDRLSGDIEIQRWAYFNKPCIKEDERLEEELNKEIKKNKAYWLSEYRKADKLTGASITSTLRSESIISNFVGSEVKEFKDIASLNLKEGARISPATTRATLNDFFNYVRQRLAQNKAKGNK